MILINNVRTGMIIRTYISLRQGKRTILFNLLLHEMRQLGNESMSRERRALHLKMPKPRN